MRLRARLLKTVLAPGDPCAQARDTCILRTLSSSLTTVRNMFGYTGTYKDAVRYGFWALVRQLMPYEPLISTELINTLRIVALVALPWR